MKKHISTLFFAFVILTSCISPAFAEENALKDGIFSYNVIEGGAVLVGVDDVDGKVIVPEKIGGHRVTEIAGGAFGASENISEVYIPDSVTKVGSMCFAYSTSIKSVRLSRNIKTIEDGTFYQCTALIGVTIPNGVTSVGSKAFAQCPNFTSVAIPDSVTYINGDAFEDTDNVRVHCRIDYSCPAYLWADARDIGCEELIKVFVNGTEIDFDQSPITEPKKFRTLVPLRSVLEFMGAEIKWHDDNEYAGVSIDDFRLLIKPNSEFMMVDGKTTFMTCPAVEYNGRMLLPIRDVVQAIGGKVAWDEDTKVVAITYKQ